MMDGAGDAKKVATCEGLRGGKGREGGMGWVVRLGSSDDGVSKNNGGKQLLCLKFTPRPR